MILLYVRCTDQYSVAYWSQVLLLQSPVQIPRGPQYKYIGTVLVSQLLNIVML